nr:hypothetical protein L204_01000 [Cryptococcus depauperatus CBS 7855]
MHSAIPNQHLALRPIYLTSTLSSIDSSVYISFPSFKLRIIPHFLVSSSLISPLALTYYIEDCVEVVVPVGGKVEISLSIDEKSLQECGVEEAGVSDKVWRKFASTLEATAEPDIKDVEQRGALTSPPYAGRKVKDRPNNSHSNAIIIFTYS